MSARPRKRSLMVAGHRTSLSLEDGFWKALHDVAAQRGLSIPSLVEEIDKSRTGGASLSGAVRLYLLDYFRQRAR